MEDNIESDEPKELEFSANDFSDEVYVIDKFVISFKTEEAAENFKDKIN